MAPTTIPAPRSGPAATAAACAAPGASAPGSADPFPGPEALGTTADSPHRRGAAVAAAPRVALDRAPGGRMPGRPAAGAIPPIRRAGARGRAAAAAVGVRPVSHGTGGERHASAAAVGGAGSTAPQPPEQGPPEQGPPEQGPPEQGPPEQGPPELGVAGSGSTESGRAQADEPDRDAEADGGPVREAAQAPGAGGRDSRSVVATFWAAMDANDWAAAAALFGDDYVCRWPQSQELIRGRDVWVVVQANFPTPSPWRFTVERMVAEGTTVVSEVTVANSDSAWRCVQFAEVVEGVITEQTEYWPEPLAAPAWRAGWVERVPRSW